VITKILFQLLFIFFFCISSEFLLPSTVQIDSTIRISALPADSIQHILNMDYRNFAEISINRLLIDELPDSLFIQYYNELILNQQEKKFLFRSSFSEQWQINDQLSNYIDYRKELALKSDLGVFGKVLGNSRTITTLILAILHVLKYRKGLY
jgi:hypothetical protein